MKGIVFLVIFLVLILLIAIIPRYLQKVYIPTVIGIMLIGILIGPNALDLIGQLNHYLGQQYPTEQIIVIIDILGLLGLIVLMTLAGMEVNPQILLTEKKAVISLSVCTFFIPAIAGYFVYYYFRPHDTIGQWVYASLFASHCVGIVFPIIKELNIVQTRFGIAILASTIITDLGSLILFAFCVQLKRQQDINLQNHIYSISIFDHIDAQKLGNYFFILFSLAIILFITFSLWILPLILQKIFNRIQAHEDAGVTMLFATTLSLSLLGELLGINTMVCCFVAGMALIQVPLFSEKNRLLHRKIEGIGYGFLIPFVFISIGLHTNMKVLLESWENISVVIFTVLGLIGSKVGSGWLAMVLVGFDHKKGFCAGLMTIPQLSATLAAAGIAYQMKLIEVNFFNAIICLSIITTIPIPILLKLFIRYTKVDFIHIPRLNLQNPTMVPNKVDEDIL